MQDDASGYHIPVLLETAIEYLVGDVDGVYVDGTLGGGGHSSRLLEELGADAHVLGFDQDADAIAHAQRLFQDEQRMTLVHSNVVHLSDALSQHEIPMIDGILLDLGVSSHQIDVPERGFSFRHEGPLDMRMDHRHSITAADIIAQESEDELARIFFSYGEERHSRRIARAIVRTRSEQKITTTGALADVIATVTSPMHRKKTLARIFQALRIAVNEELRVLEETLEQAFAALKVGGRLVVISYHSLEDRLVKRFMRHEAAHCICPPQAPVCTCGKVARMKILSRKHKEADENEIRRNPRARSARLRAGEKIHA